MIGIGKTFKENGVSISILSKEEKFPKNAKQDQEVR